MTVAEQTVDRPLERPADQGLAGVIEVRGILGPTVSSLGIRIVGGTWQPGSVIPKETDLCAEMQVSRSVIREAFRILGAKGLIRSRTSDGTRVLPRADWRLLDPDVMDWRMRAGDTTSLLQDLLRVRLVVEPGMVHVATLTASDAARDRVARAWAAKQQVIADPGDSYPERRRRFIVADMEFHRSLLAAVESDLLLQLFAVIEAAMGLLLDVQLKARGYTIQMIGIEESEALHEAVYVAFAAGDAVAAEVAMRHLIDCAIKDARGGFAQLGG